MTPVKTQGLELAVVLSLFHLRGSIVLLSLSYVMMLTVGTFMGFVDLGLDGAENWLPTEGRKEIALRMSMMLLDFQLC